MARALWILFNRLLNGFGLGLTLGSFVRSGDPVYLLFLIVFGLMLVFWFTRD